MTWWFSRGAGFRRATRSIAVATGWMATASASAVVGLGFEKKIVLAVFLPAAFVAGAVIAVFSYVLGGIIEGRRVTLETAHEFADKALTSEIDWLSGSPSVEAAVPHDDPLKMIRALVQGAYDTLETRFVSGDPVLSRIDFEVTFMTLSYIDSGITIPVCANRYGRQPKSMLVRPGKPQKYDTTVTADVYRDELHEPRIHEDTSDPKYDQYYRQYEDQRNRIRSHVVWPVLSAQRELLGTFVMHCDQTKFFRARDRKFWEAFCEVFTRPLAVAKLQLDRAVSAEQIPPPF